MSSAKCFDKNRAENTLAPWIACINPPGGNPPHIRLNLPANAVAEVSFYQAMKKFSSEILISWKKGFLNVA